MQIDLSGFIPEKFVLGLKTKGRLIIVAKEVLLYCCWQII